MKRLFILLLSLASTTATAESGSYGVEIIIFRHLDLISEGLGVEALRSFEQFPGTDQVHQFEESLVASHELPDDLRINSEISPRMDDVWNRLKYSSDYQPLIYVAWEQNRTDYYPPMRIHDQEIIDKQLRLPKPDLVTDILATDLEGEDYSVQNHAVEYLLANYQHTFYQLDGSVQLRRSRFLHLYVDLEIRLPTPKPDHTPVFPGEVEIQSEPVAQDKSIFQVLSLKQNRQIRTGQMQYFDTPAFGALIFVSAIPPT